MVNLLNSLALAGLGYGLCETLDKALPGLVVYPNTTAFDTSNIYWSRRQDSSPSCVVLPRSPREVASALKTITANSFRFTVKGGGHTTFDGGSSLQNGIVISLDRIKGITIAPDRSIVSVGPGARWINVSEALAPLGLAAVGGRSPDVGVSGFLLGGGLSFLTGRRGFGCDNVANFQVALVSGDVVDASPHKNRDLFWALRGGGGSSFGIVTRFDLQLYPQGDIWSQLNVWSANQSMDVLQTFSKTTKEKLHSGLDPDSHFMYGINYVEGPQDGLVLTNVYAFHLNLTSPYAPNQPLDTMQAFSRIPNQIANQTLVTNLPGQIRRLSAGGLGQRESWYTTTVRDGPETIGFFKELEDAWYRYAGELRAAAKSRNTTIYPSMAFQPLINPALEAMQSNGGNAAGLEPNEFPSYIIHLPVNWVDPALDDLVDELSNKLIGTIDGIANRQGFGHGFKYMNYAGKLQDVIGSYGSKNQLALEAIARRYDKERLLRKLWKGYFKP
ncbi:FAD-binding domain-containing protein 24 [Elsinoe fawcettii]|nr:FAD-binding domain-containing protein 24 [Elsinoe fawcettii]